MSATSGRRPIKSSWPAAQPELKANDGDLWDSGRVDSDQSIQVPYAGKPLVSNEQCFWKVRVWDKDGKASAWSRPAEWTMGLLQPSDWQARVDRPGWRGGDRLSRWHELDLVSGRRAGKIRAARRTIISAAWS